MSAVGIRHIHFIPGERKLWYRQLPDIEARIAALDIPDDEELWGWGYCHLTSEAAYGQVLQAFRATLSYLEEQQISVQAVVGCLPSQGSGEEFMAALEAGVLPALRLARRDLHLVEHGDCVNVLQAAEVARRQVLAGARNVLVLAAEKLADETIRFRKYSLFSDFYLALLLTGEPDRCEYELQDVIVMPDPQPARDTSRILSRALEEACVTELLTRCRLTRAEIGRFLYLNLYAPIAEMKARDTGFGRSQQFTSVSSELGHCYGADPFINLWTLKRNGRDSCHHVLCASGRGYAAAALVRIVAGIVQAIRRSSDEVWSE